MNTNPYTPPGAPVADVSPPAPPMQRPRQVVLAVQLAVATWVLGIFAMFLSWDYYSALQPVSVTIATQVLTVVLSGWIYFKIYSGRNWARIVLLVFSIIGAPMYLTDSFMDLMAAAPVLAKVQMVFGAATTLIGLWLLFLSPGREWFRKRTG